MKPPRTRRASRPVGAEAPHPPEPLVLGVLGGIASGKSLVARRLAGPEGRVVVADELAHEVLESAEVRELVRQHFGEGVFGPTGAVDREALGELVFDAEKGSEARRRLEGWTHPRVRARILEHLREARAEGVPRVVLDVPLLLENDAQHGLARLCKVLVFVDSDAGVRDQRARRARGWPPGEVARREAAQMPLEEKRRRADHVIPNTGSMEELERRVARVLDDLVGG